MSLVDAYLWEESNLDLLEGFKIRPANCHFPAWVLKMLALHPGLGTKWTLHTGLPAR